jgi:nicotinate-nucleotide pyrophosphorylase (carboxylating)
MSFTPAESEAFRRLAAWALEEDLGPNGDLTSQAAIPAGLPGRAVLVARSPGVLAGLPAAEGTFALVDPGLSFRAEMADGASLRPGDRLATVSGRMRSILTAERTALNFLQRLSGVATQTRRYVDAVAGLPCRILDTRKTTPGWRLLEKYAVRCGGGHNHRMGLGDGVLIKDNHLAALQGDGTFSREPGASGGESPVAAAVRLARAKYGNNFPLEIEVDDLGQLDEALAAGPDIVLLDNMSPAELAEAVHRRNAKAPGVLLEASGGVTLAGLRAIAETGVDRISVGALTHSAPALDIALDYLT